VDPEVKSTFIQYGRLLERVKRMVAVINSLSQENEKFKERISKLEGKAINSNPEALELKAELKKLKSENKTLKEKETKIKTKIERLTVKLEQLHL
jgi:cell division protein FtsB